MRAFPVPPSETAMARFFPRPLLLASCLLAGCASTQAPPRDYKYPFMAEE